MDLLGVLARVELAPAAPLEALLREAAVQLPWGATLVAVTPRPSAELFAALGYLRRRGFAVAVWLVQPERPISEWRPAAARLGLPVRRILRSVTWSRRHERRAGSGWNNQSSGRCCWRRWPVSWPRCWPIRCASCCRAGTETC
jgi:hypothetical protein